GGCGVAGPIGVTGPHAVCGDPMQHRGEGGRLLAVGNGGGLFDNAFVQRAGPVVHVRDDGGTGVVVRRTLRPLLLKPAGGAVGQAVRLVQGQAGSETSYGDPLEAALQWQTDGAQWIHLVDLDAAFGRGSNANLLREVVGKVDVAVELSGGIRDDESLDAAL